MTRGERIFVWLTVLSIGAIALVIVLGALVRITNADLACGRNYPLCNGRLVPAMGNHLAWLDWGHRLTTALTGLIILLTTLAARRNTLKRAVVMRRIYVIVGLLALQVAVGAGTLLLDSPDTLPALHLGLAIIMLGSLVSALIARIYHPLVTHHRDGDNFPAAVYGATLMTFLVLMTGAMIVGGAVEQSCASFPLCGGNLSDGDIIHLVHRGSVLVLGILFATLIWRARSERAADRSATYGTVTLLMLYSVQVTLGALIVISGSGTIIKTLHVLLATLMWATAAAFSTAMAQQQQSHALFSISMEQEWEKPSSAITSS